MISKRSFLAGISGVNTLVFSGCLNRGETRSGPSVVLEVTVDDIDSTNDLPVSFRPHMIEKRMGQGDTAELEVTISNDSSKHLMIVTGNKHVFSDHSSGPETPGLLLLTGSEREYSEIDKNDCWTLDHTIGQDSVGVATELEPDGQRSKKFSVAGYREEFDGPCPSTGRYRFSQQYRVLAPSKDDGQDGYNQISKFRWGFYIELDG